MPFDYDEWLANKEAGLGVKSQVPASFAMTVQPSSTAVAPITQKKVGTLKPEDPASAAAILRNIGRDIGRLVDPKTLSEGSKELLDQINQADPFTEKGRGKLNEIITQFGEPLRDWFRVLSYFGSSGPKGLIPSDVQKSLTNIGYNPLAGPLTAGMIVGGASGVGRLAGRARTALGRSRLAPIAEGEPPVTVAPEIKIARSITGKTRVGALKIGEEPVTPKPAGRPEVELAPTITEKTRAGVLKIGDKVPTEVASEFDVSVQKVMQALKEAKPIRKKQEVLFAKERGARLAKAISIREKVTGEKGFFAEKGQLKGELPKIEFESIREKISQTDIDNLFKKVVDSGVLTEWEKLPAREGLSKMLGEYGGRVPTKRELILLEQVFPVEFIEAIMKKGPLSTKIKEGVLQAANVPRSIMSSFDLSFGLRQGAFAAPRFRKAFWNSWKEQFRIFGSEKAYQASREALIRDKNFGFAKESKVAFTEVGKTLTQREEAFQSQWAEKIPLVGKGVRASGRAYTAFANKYRLDIFKKLVADLERQGLKPRENPFLARKVADFVNNATGRGSLGGLENAAVGLNAVFFSPRLNMARLRLLNPIYYIKQPKGLRKQALLTALGAGGTAATILSIAKLGGADVTADPRNADFGKIKIGNTRLDMLAGFGQFIRGATQIASGQYVSSTTGKTVTLGEGFRAPSRMDILIRQIESKEAPVASFATGLLRGENWGGENFSIPKEVGSRFVPMVIADMIDIAKDDPKLLPLVAPAVFGIGLQTYSPKDRKKLSLGRGVRTGGR